MNEQAIEEIKNAIRQIVEFISSQPEEPPPEIVELLEQVIQHAADRIQQLRQEAPPPSPPVTLELEAGPYPSSNIHSFKYNPQNGQLFIKFMGKDVADNGPIYSYSNIPQNIFNIFRRGAVAPTTSGRNRWHRWQEGVTPSLGAAAYHLIRSGGFPYQRVS